MPRCSANPFLLFDFSLTFWLLCVQHLYSWLAQPLQKSHGPKPPLRGSVFAPRSVPAFIIFLYMACIFGNSLQLNLLLNVDFMCMALKHMYTCLF